jgi:hypothetical protein
MRRVFVACLLFTACTRYYEPPEGWEGPYTATAVLNQALVSAQSKIDPMEGADTLVVTATIRVQQEGEPIDADYVVRWQRPDKYSIEVVSGPLAGRRIVCDGERAAEFNGATLSRPSIPRDETGIAQFMNRLFVLHFFRTGQGDGAELKENTTSAKGEPWIHLYKQDGRGRPHYLMLDAKSLEPRLLRTFVPYQDGTDRAIDTLFENFTVDARAGRVPLVWKSYEGNKLREELRIRSLAWNQRQDEAAFTIP